MRTTTGRCPHCAARFRVFDARLAAPIGNAKLGPEGETGVIAEEDGSFACPRCGRESRVADGRLIPRERDT